MLFALEPFLPTAVLTFPGSYLSAYEGPAGSSRSPQMLGDGPEGQFLPAGSQASWTQTVIPPNSPQSAITNLTKLNCSCSVEPTRTITSVGLSSYHCIVLLMYIYFYLFYLQ
jgi:hypothetical protein